MLPTLAAFLILLILLLAIPVNLVFALHKEAVWRGRIVVYCCFGLTQFRVRRGRAKKGRRRIKMAASSVIKQRRYLYSILRSDGVAPRMVILFKEMLRALRPRRFRLQCVVGLDDPADTGRLMGLIAPFRAFAGRLSPGRHPKLAIQVTPDFSGPRFKGQCCASVQFVPLRLIALGLGFFFSSPVLRALTSSIRAQKVQTDP